MTHAPGESASLCWTLACPQSFVSSQFGEKKDEHGLLKICALELGAYMELVIVLKLILKSVFCIKPESSDFSSFSSSEFAGYLVSPAALILSACAPPYHAKS